MMQIQLINAAKTGKSIGLLSEYADRATPRNAFLYAVIEVQDRRELSALEARLNADAHVVAGDRMDQGCGEFPHEQREARTQRFIENESIEAPDPAAEKPARSSIETRRNLAPGRPVWSAAAPT